MPPKARKSTRRGAWLRFALVIGVGAACAACQTRGEEEVGSQSGPIIGGRLDTINRGVVSLLAAVGDGFAPSCSGTLLTPNLVLTARHCVAQLSSADGASIECDETAFGATRAASSLLVSVETKVGRDGLEPYRVARVWVPSGNNAVCGRDIAMVLLAGSGVPASLATPIAPKLSAEVSPDEVLSAIGYGLQSPDDRDGETAGDRMGVTDAQVFCTGSECGTQLVRPSEWLAESPVCSGDSGGPALNQDGQVVGVTSRGDVACTFGIYSSVFAWRDFIVDKTLEAAALGGYTAPDWVDPPTAGSGGMSSGGGADNAGAAPGAGGEPLIVGGPSSPSGGSPTVDPLGLECSNRCPGAYRCWSESGKPPGICVPLCDGTNECPTGYSCSESRGACLPSSPAGEPVLEQGGSCSVGSPAAQGTNASLLSLLLVAVTLLRRARQRT